MIILISNNYKKYEDYDHCDYDDEDYDMMMITDDEW